MNWLIVNELWLNCGFLSAPAGFVRMEFGAKVITKRTHAIRNWGQICPANVRHLCFLYIFLFKTKNFKKILIT
jgi:hypothetical protein